MVFIITAHILLRWLILAVGAAALIRLALGLARRSAYDRLATILVMAFSGLMDLQGTLGLIYLIWNGLTLSGFPLERWVHAGVMVIAIVVSHLPSRWKSAADIIRYRAGFLAVVGALVLTVVGVALLSILAGARIGG